MITQIPLHFAKKRPLFQLKKVSFFYLFEQKKPDFLLRSASLQGQDKTVEDFDPSTFDFSNATAVVDLTNALISSIASENTTLVPFVTDLATKVAGITVLDPTSGDYMIERSQIVVEHSNFMNNAMFPIRRVFSQFNVLNKGEISNLSSFQTADDKEMILLELQANSVLFLASLEAFALAAKGIPLMEFKSENFLNAIQNIKATVEPSSATFEGMVNEMLGLEKEFLTFEGAWLTSFNQENAFLSSQSMAAAALAVKARAGTTTSVSLAPSPVPALTTAVGGTSVGSPSPSGTSSPSASGGTGGSVSSPPGTLPTTLPSSPPVVSAIDIRLVLQKLSNSQNLTVQEENLIKSIGIGDLAALANEPVFNKFSVGVNTVVKVRFNFKLLNVYKAAATLVDSSGNPLDNRSIPIEDLNFATFKSDLYCAIVVNDGSVDTEAVLDLFYTDFFVKHFQPILSQLVVLENIQIQCFWPFKALGAFDQSSYDAIGDCPASQLISSKPFCFNLTSSLVKSKKNAFQFAIPGVTKELQDRAFYETKKTELAKFCKILMSPIKLGAGSLVLSLVMPTKKANTPVSFVPITSCYVSGFTANYKKSLLFRNSKEN